MVADSSPARWRPPAAPDWTGPLAENRALTGIDAVVRVEGPEDVAFDDAGRLYTGTDDGAVRRTVEPVGPETTDAETERYAVTDGRVLGLEFHGDDLIAAARGAGLVSIGPDGDVATLADSAGGRAIEFADDLHVADDGTVYFTDASVHDRFQEELFTLHDTGRLLAYRPDSGETTVELTDLGFANGVAPGPDGASLLVSETSRYRVTRYWLGGGRAGEAEPFAANLPGYPDNVDAAGDGSAWVAIPGIRDPTTDWLHGHPWLKRLSRRLPSSVRRRTAADPYGLVLRLDADGEAVESLHDSTGAIFSITSATPHEGALYLGTLRAGGVYRYPLE